MITVTYDVLVAAPGVSPDVLVDSEDQRVVEACGVIDQDPLALGQDNVVGGVPRDPEPFGDPGHREVLDHDPFQRPHRSPRGTALLALRS